MLEINRKTCFDGESGIPRIERIISFKNEKRLIY